MLSESQGGWREALHSKAITTYIAHLSLANIWNSLYLEDNQLGACVTVSIPPWQQNCEMLHVGQSCYFHSIGSGLVYRINSNEK